MRFGFFSLGCKVNRFESEALAHLARERGHEVVDRDADAFIINTCTVTSVSDHKNIRAIHRIRRDNPRALLVACGCLAQTDPDKLQRMGEVDLICGTSDRAGILELCERRLGGEPVDTSRFRSRQQSFELLPAGVPRGRTRALLKIQDGCDNYCTYCIIPYARGHVRSMPPEHVLDETRRLAAEGVHEIVLTGIEISSYGRDLDKAIDLTGLVAMVCAAAPNVRIRLGSLEPRTVNERFCQTLFGFSNLMPHFHLSLQSGCDSTLACMKRRYTTDLFAQNITRLRAAFPDCAVTTDVIVGFPGETEADFCQSLAFAERCSFADMHVFPYSPRTGTPAASMTGQVSEAVKEERAMRMKQAAAHSRSSYLAGFVGKELDVLFEHRDRAGFWCGHSPYSFIVRTADKRCQKNAYARIRVTGSDDSSVLGEVIALQKG